jgi:hypothetical protein
LNPLALRAALLLTLGLASATAPAAEQAATAEAGLLLAEPPQAQPGECWAQLMRPARYERRSVSVVKTPAGERYEQRPARYQWVEKTEVRPAGKRRVVVTPAEYEVSEEQVLVQPAGVQRRTQPAQYTTVEERMVSRTGTVLKPHPVTGEICAVEGPIEYQLVKRRQLLAPARSESIDRPAVYKTVRHRKLIKPAETQLVDARERVVKRRVRELVEPAHEVAVPTPPVYEDVVHVVQISPARNQWFSVVCDTNATPALLQNVQQALAKAGFDPGAMDGRWGPRSVQALRRYQQQAGLTPGGLTIETLQSLGVALGGAA